jgi:hypothetical protein
MIFGVKHGAKVFLKESISLQMRYGPDWKDGA